MLYCIHCAVSSSLNTRFGTVAVPNILVFHSAKAVARFNGTERTLDSLVEFVAAVTGMYHWWNLFYHVDYLSSALVKKNWLRLSWLWHDMYGAA